ncbi:MAG: polysaccharide deacetylase family protein [Candidatus Cloacimonadaceae bacterium]|nr:polysaccharide deacetylase family protein [Candidatus Cloacimonadaceae bacterium]
MVRETAERGHEIGSHGMYHKLIYKMTSEEFYEDALSSRLLLESVSGKRVECFRSPSFSIIEATPWFFDNLTRAGYVSDSSMFPVKRERGGYLTKNVGPHWVKTKLGNICEFPISVAPIFGKDVCFFGGGYLRLFPKWLILCMQNKLSGKGIPTLFYIHPREIDPLHPRLKMSAWLHFKTYINMKTVRPKLEAIFHSNSFVTCHEYMITKMMDK